MAICMETWFECLRREPRFEPLRAKVEEGLKRLTAERGKKGTVTFREVQDLLTEEENASIYGQMVGDAMSGVPYMNYHPRTKKETIDA